MNLGALVIGKSSQIERTVLDANIFFSMWILDPILSIADTGLFEPVWSQQIINEVQQHLPDVWQKAQMTQITSFLAAIQEAFPWSSHDNWNQYLGNFMLPDPNDNHVLALALASGSSIIVTNNIRDFPDKVLQPLGVTAITPDEFLTALLNSDEKTVVATIQDLIQEKQFPPRTFFEEIRGLQHVGLHNFAKLLQTKLSQFL